MQEKHRNATAQKETAGFKVPSPIRPFKKKRLYPVKPDEKMNKLKRKRAPNNTKGTTYNDSDLPMMDGFGFIPQGQKPSAEYPREPQEALSGRPVETLRRLVPKGLSSNGRREGISLQDILSSTVGPADVVKSSEDKVSPDLEIGNPM